MKYVMFETKRGALYPVCFPDDVVHADVSIKGMKAISAGEVNVGTGQCSGGSTSLKLDSFPMRDSSWVTATLVGSTTRMIALNTARTLKKARKDKTCV